MQVLYNEPGFLSMKYCASWNFLQVWPCVETSVIVWYIAEFLLKTEGREDNNFPFVDYDEYDAQVFKLPSRMFQR